MAAEEKGRLKGQQTLSTGCKTARYFSDPLPAAVRGRIRIYGVYES